MTEARLPPLIVVGALLRRAEAEGGFGVVIAKGDPNSGTIIISLRSRTGVPTLLERLPTPDFSYSWQTIRGAALADGQQVDDYVARRRDRDPDLWVIELDVAAPERFADEINDIG